MNKFHQKKARAVLLVGPTGSGKSPVGDSMEEFQTPLAGTFYHFDFGAALRGIASKEAGKHLRKIGKTYELLEEDVEFIRYLIDNNQLLPEDRFDIAKKILSEFLNHMEFSPEDDVLVLNGLPRHEHQAHDIREIVDIEGVFLLDASDNVVNALVAQRFKGLTSDHSGRDDDTPEAVSRKVATFHQQTLPILKHYEEIGVPVIKIPVGLDTDPGDVARLIVKKLDRMF